ncbi:MAG: hypothetical protein M1831_007522, partial [Alyxoria varia]
LERSGLVKRNDFGPDQGGGNTLSRGANSYRNRYGDRANISPSRLVSIVDGISPDTQKPPKIGGSSGIGLAIVDLLVSKQSRVFNFDIQPPPESQRADRNVSFIPCDVSSWADLLAAFDKVGEVIDTLFVNAGVSDTSEYFAEKYDSDGRLQQPNYRIIDVNLRAVCDAVKIGPTVMKKSRRGGGIVITTSATGYVPEEALPIYSAVKTGSIGLIRSLRNTLIKSNITINGIAPALTETNMPPADYIALMRSKDMPVSPAHCVALAALFSATATESRRVELYGAEAVEAFDKGPEALLRTGRWNGRVLFTMGDTYTEVEEDLTDMRVEWFGRTNLLEQRRQQELTEFLQKGIQGQVADGSG